MWTERLSVCRSEVMGKISGKDSPSTQTQDTMEARRMTESGERLGRLWRKESRQKDKNRRKSVEIRKIRINKRIKMVFLQNEW